MKPVPALLAVLLSLPAAAAPRSNVLETLSAALAQDRAYDAAERGRLLGAIKTRFADYGVEVVTESRRPAIPVLLHVITEGSFDRVAPERVAEVAFAAYQAMSRGARAEEVEGIALYGYRKKISGDTIAAWANGYRQMVDAKVPDPIAADLVNLAMSHDLSVSDFDLLKWALVDGVKEGYNAKDYSTFLFGHMAKGKAKPGEISAAAKTEFRRARAEGRRPRLPEYSGSVVPPPPPAPVYQAPVQAPVQPPAPARVSEAPTEPEAPEATRSASSESPRPSAASRAAVGESPRMSGLWPKLDATAHAYLGTPYVWGGTSHNGIDCSGLTHNTYGENRVEIPRVSRDQYHTGASVSEGELRNGDLVFFNTLGVGVSHVGMIVDAGSGQFIQASSSKGVTISPLSDKYYKTRYLGARRVVP